MFKVYRGLVHISQLADQVGVPVSTIRFYERTGLLNQPRRTGSGYRDYDGDAATRLLFVTRARKLGLTCEQIASLLPVWDGAHCSPTQDRMIRLIQEKKAEISVRIEALTAFAAELDDVLALLESGPPPGVCRTDLTCCVPAGPDGSASTDIRDHHRMLPLLN